MVVLLILNILSFIFTKIYKDKHNTNLVNNETICISPTIKDFIIYWIKFNIEIVTISNSIILKKVDYDNNFYKLENTKNILINLFNKISNNAYGNKFQEIINEQIYLKLNLCKNILDNDELNTNTLSKKIIENSNNLTELFLEMNKHNTEFKKIMSSHTDKYIKTMKFMNKTGDDEIGRELIYSSIDSAKLLFV